MPYKKPKSKLKRVTGFINFSSTKKRILVFMSVFVFLGAGYLLYNSFAASSPYDLSFNPASLNNNKKGLNYNGLLKVKDNSNHVCEGEFTVQNLTIHGSPVCTHGPDPVPPGVVASVKAQKSVSRLTKELKVTSKKSQSQISSMNIPNVQPAIFGSGGGLRNPWPATAPKCYGNGSDGARVVLIYTYWNNDRYSQLEPLFQIISQKVDTAVLWSSTHSGSGSVAKRIRFYQNSSNCKPIILKVHVKNYSPYLNDYENAVNAVKSAFNNPTRKYLIWYDNSLAIGCGMGSSQRDTNPNASSNRSNIYPQYAVISPICWNYAEGHEMFHMFGAVSNTAPHSSGAGHCWDQYDLMCYNDNGPKYKTFVQPACSNYDYYKFIVDCYKDDYFNSGHVPAGSYLSNNWNTANSPDLGN